MNDSLNISHAASCEVVRAPKGVTENLSPKGKFTVEHYRAGVKIGEYEINNLTTNEGRATMLSVFFHGLTQITTWYLGLIDSTGYGTGPAVTDTYAQMASGNSSRENTAYTDTNNSGNGGTPPCLPSRGRDHGCQPGRRDQCDHERLYRHHGRHRQGPVRSRRRQRSRDQIRRGRRRRPVGRSPLYRWRRDHGYGRRAQSHLLGLGLILRLRFPLGQGLRPLALFLFHKGSCPCPFL